MKNSYPQGISSSQNFLLPTIFGHWHFDSVMGPKASEEPLELRDIELANVPNQGLGYHDKNNKVVLVSDANLQLVGT